MDLTLILPAYNEAARIAGTIGQAAAFFRGRGTDAEIIVAADGDDGTREIARDLAASIPALRVIGEPARRGKGRGIREAVAISRGRIVGFADADNKVPIEEYSQVEECFGRGCEIVIGSRGSRQARIERPQPLYRRLGGRGFGVFMRLMTGLPFRDTQCGFKFFQADVARNLFSRQRVDGYMFDVEILLIAHRLGFKIGEIPVRWRDDNDSRLDLVRGNLGNLRDILRIRRMHSGLGRDAGRQSAGAATISGG